MLKTVKGLYLKDGKCVCKPNFLVSGLLPDEEGNVEIIGKKGPEYICEVREITKPSPYRIKPICSYDACGGCSYKYIDYEAQMKFKMNYIQTLFKPFNAKINTIKKMDKPLASRYKTIASFGMNKSKIIAGIYEEGSHNIVNVENCPIQNLEANKLIKGVKLILANLKIEPYNIESDRGIVRHIYIRTGYYTKEIMVTIVTKGDLFPNHALFCKKILELEPKIKTIVQNINPRDTSIVLGDKERVLYGNGYIKEQLLGLTFSISSKSFFQVNPLQAEVLYREALRMARLTKNDTVLDAYSGTGTISLCMSGSCKNVLAVELSKEATKDAIQNAKQNGINNVRFINEDATRYLQKLEMNHERIDCLVMDPPRNGSTPEFMKAIKGLKPKRIVYISCGPDTQVRDIELVKDMYKVVEVTPVDMFGYTHHVESVCLLSLKNQ